MDIELAVKNVQSGSETDYTYIMTYYENKIYTTVFRLVCQHDTAQDLVQEIFIKVFYNLHKYKAVGSFNAWLYRIVVNQCYDYLRKQSKQPLHGEIESIEIQSPENKILQKEQLQQLDQLLHQLDKTEYLILLLRYINELSYDEISEVLQIPLNEVRNKLHRSKCKLRQLATKKGGYFHEMQ
ncbi:RNA polymerase sigma factor [Ureibacillus sinduriensis]|uniref:RNA polymerase sigma factor n=1 Tax=Ureibacillus sinduriensis BLB-1 = JCM 15800 TaxID=1384057 RepID=A0A0A3I178_9BACL|nr:RNA polymerase sigma factor [Ureibacillus sinduriensis]KGR78591.1 hypothetical protein CD33_00980 [Ureibacillus sinduriensis BLB-1 = JCM 15800]